jgi:hypothetical protein
MAAPAHVQRRAADAAADADAANVSLFSSTNADELLAVLRAQPRSFYDPVVFDARRLALLAPRGEELLALFDEVASPALLTCAQAPRGRALEARRRRLTLQAELSLERPLREVSSIRAEATVNYHLGRTAASERRRYTLCMECSLQEAGGCAANPLCRSGA